MAPKTIKAAIADVLSDLSTEDFDRFRYSLRDRRDEPRVKRNQVEGKNYREIADLLVSTFTECKAHLVAVELLKEMRCGDEAEELEKLIADICTKPAAGPSGAVSDVKTKADGKHFVDKHRTQLIDRVTNVEPILDRLLDEKVIQKERYDDIRALPTPQKKMRLIFDCLSAGPASKDVFYKILEEKEIYLIEDLKENH